MITSRKENLISITFLIVFTLIYSLFNLITSPLYNSSSIVGDTSIYLSISKQMLDGNVLYKEIFDHKGPFMFFIYLIPVLFKNINIGLFILDLLIINTIVILNYKTLKLYCNSIISLFFVVVEIILLFIFHNNVNAELISLLIISYLNYWILSKQYLKPTFIQLLICGILTGIIFWIKFTLSIYIAVVYFYFVYIHIKNKTFNIKYILYPLLGFLIPTIIVFGYFIYYNALYDLFECYFLINSRYGNTRNFIPSTINIIFISLILILFILSIKKELDKSILILSYFALFIVAIIITKYNFNYYHLPFIGILSLIPLIIKSKIDNKIIKLNIIWCFILTLMFSSVLMFNRYKINIEKSQHTYSKDFAKDVNYNIDSIAMIGICNPDLLLNIKSANYKYFFAPTLTYNQNPTFYETLYNDVKNFNIEYVVVDKSYHFIETVENDKKTSEIYNLIINYIRNNYIEFNEYTTPINNYIVYKRP